MKDYDRDSFWNIDSLVPKSKKRDARPLQRKKLFDYFVDNENSSNSGELPIDEPDNDAAAKKDDIIYYPYHSFIKRVDIKHNPDKVDFHANFLKAAHLYFDARAEECEYVPFYSYMPRYPQLNDKQKKYYFFWRENVRCGNYLKCDKSYLELLIYEIINLPDLIPPKEAVEELIGLWCEYRKRFPAMDESFARWIQDYCLVNQIECPTDRLSDFIFKILSKLSFPEFFLGDICFDKDESIDALLSCLSDYSWQAGKYAGGENKEIYKRHMLRAMRRVLLYLNDNGVLFNEDNIVEREWRAFVGATVGSLNKYTIKISYTPLNTTLSGKAEISSAVRYTENKLRMLLGVKSRLAVKDLSDECRRIIDKYFEELIARAATRQRAVRPEYEELYEAENNTLSLGDAESIEKESWITTARLVDIEDAHLEDSTEDEELEEATQEGEAEKAKSEGDNSNQGENQLVIDVIKAAFAKDTARMKEIAIDAGELLDAIIERINEMFVDIIGDIIFEQIDDTYMIIEDYKEDVSEWLLKM